MVGLRRSSLSHPTKKSRPKLRQLRDDALARKTGRTSKTPTGAKRRSIISSVLQSIGKQVEEFTLESVIAQATKWLKEGTSCFARQVETRGLSPPHESPTSEIPSGGSTSGGKSSGGSPSGGKSSGGKSSGGSPSGGKSLGGKSSGGSTSPNKRSLPDRLILTADT